MNDKVVELKVVPKPPKEQEYIPSLPDAEDFDILCSGKNPKGLMVGCINEEGIVRFYKDGLDDMECIALSAMMHRASLNQIETFEIDDE